MCICSGTGGPQAYTGRDMLTTHRGVNANEQEFVAVLDDIVEGLQGRRVGQREQEELLMIFWSLKAEIVVTDTDALELRHESITRSSGFGSADDRPGRCGNSDVGVLIWGVVSGLLPLLSVVCLGATQGG